MSYRILKFGGTSLKNKERISSAADIISKELTSGRKLGVVVSALGGITDSIGDAAQVAMSGDVAYEKIYQKIFRCHMDICESLIPGHSAVLSQLESILSELKSGLDGIFLLRDITMKRYDSLLGCGERMSAEIMTAYLQSMSISAEMCDTRFVIVTNSYFGNAVVNFKLTTAAIEKEMSDNCCDVKVITGFIASDKNGETTTLGRSGSDYTASIFASALKADKIEIWTDVDGVMTADPGKTRHAFVIPELTYKDAMELSHFGAKVIFPPTMIPAMRENIPIHILNSFNPGFPGTVIGNKAVSGFRVATGIASIDDTSLLRIHGSGMVGVRGISARLFDTLAAEKINIILITQASSEHSICFAVIEKEAENAKIALESAFELEIAAGLIDGVSIDKETAIIAVVGEGMRHRTGVSAKVFSSLGDSRINVMAISQGSSERNISIVVDRQDEKKAVNVLHRALFPIREKAALYLIGTGLVARELMILLKRPEIAEHLQLNGIMNTRRMLTDTSGLMFDGYGDLSASMKDKSDLQAFMTGIKNDTSTCRICVDCTASSDIAGIYGDCLKNGISVVTPSKIANTAPMNKYNALREAAADGQACLRYETNVGAALPVISTLKTMLSTGDDIQRIQAVLSGTLSYIFNMLSEDVSFSSAVRKAVELGYAEPDPREDLTGQDVARKALILARELGYELNMDDSVPEPLISDKCLNAATLDQFYREMEKNDEKWAAKLDDLKKNGWKLRYIAEVGKGEISIAVREIDSLHPFYNLSGPDNIVAIYSRRYPINPLVIKGAGAGAAVTAGGVLGDIMSIVEK